MPQGVVTGAAGFIGSHLCAALLVDGWRIRGLDSLAEDAGGHKRRRVAALAARGPRFSFARRDLARDPLADELSGADVVFHLAGRPGVRGSFGAGFDAHLEGNLRATQRLVEALARRGGGRLVFASTSSVYGEAGPEPVCEDAPTRPRSPYGVTKLAAEGLPGVYGLDCVVLRYFTVFGPEQRPDMAFHRFLRAAIDGTPAPLHGDGGQTRDFTYVGDAVAATVAAGWRGEGVYNVGGGSPATLSDALAAIAALAGRPVPLLVGPPARGDVRHTRADTTRARRDLGYRPRVGLREGLALQLGAMGAPARATGGTA